MTGLALLLVLLAAAVLFVKLQSWVTEAPLKEQPARYFYAPKPGYTWNPLVKHRNMPCPCDSGLKAKRCCGQFDALPIDVATAVSNALRSKRRDRNGIRGL